MPKRKDSSTFVWAPLPGAVMWPVLLVNEQEPKKKSSTSSVFCNCDQTEFIVKSSQIVPYRENYHLKDSGTNYLKKKKKYDTLNCFLSDIKWIEEMINQSSPVKKRLQDKGSFTAQQDSTPPTTLPGALPPALPPSITQPDLSLTTTGPVLPVLPPTAQPDLTPPTAKPNLPPTKIQPDSPKPITQPNLPSPSKQQVSPPPTTQPDSPPPTTRHDSPPPSPTIQHDSPPPSTRHDSPPPSPTTRHDSPPPSTQQDSPPPTTQPDLPPNSTQPDLPPNSTQPDLPPNSTQPDLPPNSTQPDLPPNSTQPDLPPNSTQPDSPLYSTQPDSPPPTTQPDLPPNSTQPDSPPSLTQPDLPSPTAKKDSSLPPTQSDSPSPTTQPDSPPTTRHDSPPPSPTIQHDSPPPSTRHDSPPPSPTTRHDSPPPSTQQDSPPPTTQPDLPPNSTQPDSPPNSTQPDSPLYSTQPDSPPPTTQPDLPPNSTQPHSPLYSTQPDSSLPTTQSDVLPTTTSLASKTTDVHASSERANGSKPHPLTCSDYSDDLVSSGSEYVPDSDSCNEEKSYVSDSECSSPQSEVFPMLSQKPISSKSVKLHEDICEESDSDDEDVNEEEITRAADDTSIYVFKILKSSTSKSGRKKKDDRVYNSYQYCHLCKKKVSNFSQHINRNRNLQAHANCEQLLDILQDEDKHSRNRKCTLLRSKFNHEFNMNTLKRGKGEIILERRPHGKFELKEYGPCPGCYLWLNHKLLRKHKNVCVAKCDFSKSASLITQSKIISGRIHTSPSKTLLNEVFSSMNMDAIGTVAREDPLIVQLGNQWIQKNVGNPLKRGAYTGQIMRLCARLLINLREIAPITEEPIFWNYLKAPFFNDIVTATLKTANAISEDNLEKPSNARKLGFDIKKLINGKMGISIMTNDEPSRKEAEDLLKTMEIFWGTRVAKLSNVLLEQRKYDKHQKLPNPDDIAELNRSLESSIKCLDLKTTTFENFTAVVEAVEAKLVIYNRRRVGELEAIRLTDYEKRRKGEAPEHLVGQLSEFERKLLKEQEVMTVRGKTGRGVPVILPAITKSALSFLTDKAIRSACGISPKNVYIFAGKEEGVIRAYNSVLKACSKAQLTNPELITSTNLRKYMATITQVLDLKPNEMTWVLDHLGHSMDVHKIHYRATSEILEKTQIAKLLLIQDTNQVGRFKDKSLSEVQMEDVVFNERETIVKHPDQESEAIDSDFMKMDSDDEENEDEPKKRRKRPCISTKLKWSIEEEEEIKHLFKKLLAKKKRPTPAQCVKAMAISKEKGGVIWKRKKDVLKKKLFRIVDKLNKG